MIGYVLLLSLILGASFIKKKHYQLIFVFSVIAIFSGIRYGIGYDYFSYLSCCIRGSYRGFRFELIPLQMVLLSRLSFPFLFFLLTSFFIAFFYYKGIRKAGDDYILETIFYVCFPLLFYDQMGIIRQGMATAVVFYAISLQDDSMEYKKKTLFTRILLLFVAVLCHQSAIIAMLILFPWGKIPSKMLWIMFISSFFLGFIVAPIVETMFATELFDSIDEEKAMAYLEAGGEDSHIRQYMLYGIAVFSLLKYEKLIKKDNRNAYFIAILVLGASLYALFPGSSSLSKRVCMFFFSSAILVVPQIVKTYKISREIFIFVMICLFSFQVYLGSRIHRLEDIDGGTVSYPYRTYIPYLNSF